METLKTVFDNKTMEELVFRINSLQSDAQANWGKMNLYQMLKHCVMSEEMFQGKTAYKRLFIGKLFGKMALKGILKNENPLKPNEPTHSNLRITENGDWSEEQKKWISMLQQYASFKNEGFVHPFFGKMSTEEIGRYVYKHTDHHLRQFEK